MDLHRKIRREDLFAREAQYAINSAETPLIEISEISVADAVAYTYKDYHARIQRQVPESGSSSG